MMFTTAWADIVPVPQDSGPNPIAPIQYDSKYTQLMDIFRACLKAGEYSQRVITLTSDLLDLNAANYTVWQYRRQCLINIKANLEEELNYIDDFADDNPKNYQIWFHRRAIAERVGSPSREIEFCNKVLDADAKNYHAWAHRQWVLKTYNCWEGELAYVTALIEDDMRNNSAWNQRWFIVHSGPDEVTKAVLTREVEFTWGWIYCAVYNESAWNYLRGLWRHHQELESTILQSCQDMLTQQGGHSATGTSPFLLALLADLREAEGNLDGLVQAKTLFLRLLELDPIRVKYWQRRADRISASLE